MSCTIRNIQYSSTLYEYNHVLQINTAFRLKRCSMFLMVTNTP